MAYDMVDRCADGFGETVVVEWRRDGLLYLGDVVMADFIEFAGGDARDNVLLNHLQNFGGQSTGDAHLFKFFGGFESDCHIFPLGVLQSGHFNAKRGN